MRKRTLMWAGAMVVMAGVAIAEVSDPRDLLDVADQVPGAIEHCDDAVASRVFLDIFDCGDELFETEFNAVDGVGARIGNGQRFTRTPRFDLDDYANITPKRRFGPDAQSCNACHPPDSIGGAGDGAGPAETNLIEDFAGIRGVSDPKNFVQRNPPHLFGVAGIQVLAEDISRDLAATRDAAVASACASGAPVTAPLSSKGVDFGSITVSPTGCPSPQIDTSAVQGVDADLVVKPFGLKGTFPGLRIFNAAAFHNALGMTPTELAGPNVDSDFDGVVNEIFVEDVTAMTIYLAAQPRPTTLIELDNIRRKLMGLDGGADVVQDLGIPSLTLDQRRQIGRGQAFFSRIGCDDCHKRSLDTDGVTFAEPSPLAAFRFDLGLDPQVAAQLDPANPLTFDITRDQPDNVIMLGDAVVTRLGTFPSNRAGGARVELFGDLKRHEMGPALAESIAEGGVLDPSLSVSPSSFITAELWGLFNTAPYLHDGRATTIEEAIIEHGGEAAASRDAFRALPASRQADVLAFLNNLVLFFPAEEEE